MNSLLPNYFYLFAENEIRLTKKSIKTGENRTRVAKITKVHYKHRYRSGTVVVVGQLCLSTHIAKLKTLLYVNNV